MKTCLLISLMFLTASCAEKKYHDRDMADPAYYEGTGVAVTDSASAGGIAKRLLVSPPPSSPDAAVMSLVESGISLAAYPDYYKSSTISGTCVIGDTTLSQVPCRHVQIELLDESGKALGTADCNDSGQFAFYVKKNKSYWLRVADAEYAIDGSDGQQALKMGEKVIIHAVRASQI